MKKKMLALIVALLVGVPAFGQDLNNEAQKLKQDVEKLLQEMKLAMEEKNNTKVIVKDDVVEVYADDLDCAKYALIDQSVLHPKACFKVYVAPGPKPDIRALVRGERQDTRLSIGKTLVERYRISYDNIVEELEKDKPEVAKKMKADPYDIRGNLVHVEQFLELDKINSKELSLTERCYRVCWVEGLSHHFAKDVQIIFFE